MTPDRARSLLFQFAGFISVLDGVKESLIWKDVQEVLDSEGIAFEATQDD